MNPAKPKFKISSVIRDFLMSDPDLSAAVSGKIFPLFAPADTEGDYILYKREFYSTKGTKMGVVEHECRIFINVISDDYTRGQEIAEMVYTTLYGDYSDGMKIRMTDATEEIADKKYIQVLLFTII